MLKLLRKLNFILPVISIIVFNSCAEDPVPSLYEELPSGLKPVITSINPTDALAGVTLLTIDGLNFSSVPHFNQVTFNGVPAEIINASANQLVVRAPNIATDTIFVLVSVVDVVPISDTTIFKLLPAVAEIKKDTDGADLFTEDLVPYGLTTDAQGNVYTSVVDFNIGQGIKKITPTGEIVPYGELINFAPKGGETFFLKLNMWQNNTILATRGGTAAAAIFEITEGVASRVFLSQGLSSANRDIDFDENFNIWVGGNGIYRVTPSKEVKSFQFQNSIKSIRIYDGYIYVLTTVNEDDAIWRFQIISSDSLGAGEEFFNISQSVQQNQGTSQVTGTDFDIAADGDIIIGTTRIIDPIIIIHQDKTFESLYPGIIPNNTRVYAFDWGPDEYLYFTREANADMIQTIFRLNMRKQGAP